MGSSVLDDGMAVGSIHPSRTSGTGIVPEDEFTLSRGDTIRIAIDGIGTLENSVA